MYFLRDLGNSIERANLNKGKFRTNIEHPTTDNVVEFEPTKEPRLKELTRTIPSPLNLVAEHRKTTLDPVTQLPHVFHPLIFLMCPSSVFSETRSTSSAARRTSLITVGAKYYITVGSGGSFAKGHAGSL